MRLARLSILFSAVLFFFNPLSAFAHTGLVASNPVSDSRLSELPKEISLIFDEDLLIIKGKQANVVELIDENGMAVKLAEPLIVGAKITTQLLESGNEPHSYQINYRVVSADGHPVNGNIQFVVNSVSLEPTQQAENKEESPLSNFSLNIIGSILIILTLVAGHFMYRKIRN